MQIPLNYKSFYAAISHGFSNKNKTAIAEILFRPILEIGTVLDRKGNVMVITNGYASEWANGTMQIQQAIKDEVEKDGVLQQIIDHFQYTVIPHSFSVPLRDEAIELIAELVKSSDLSQIRIERYLQLFHEKKYSEFLGRVFQRALLGDNVQKMPPPEIQIYPYSGIMQYTYPSSGVIPMRVKNKEHIYVHQLFAVYENLSGVIIRYPRDLEAIHFRAHFDMQRKMYYKAENVHQAYLDQLMENEIDPFEILKEEIYDATYEVRNQIYHDPFEKLNAVLQYVTTVPISSNIDYLFHGCIGPGEKKGICHMLVNEEKMKWIEE